MVQDTDQGRPTSSTRDFVISHDDYGHMVFLKLELNKNRQKKGQWQQTADS